MTATVSTSQGPAPLAFCGHGSPTLRQVAPPSVEVNSTEVAFSAPPATWPKVASTTVRPLAASWAPACWPPGGRATSCQSPLPSAARCTEKVQPGAQPGCCPLTRSAEPSTISSEYAEPPGCRCQLAPPSVVRKSELGPKAYPTRAVAKRSPVTRSQALGQVSVWPSRALGAGMPVQVLPPSVVRTIEVHGGCPHDAVPSAQPTESLIQVRSTARKPAGTGPPAGPALPELGAAVALDWRWGRAGSAVPLARRRRRALVTAAGWSGSAGWLAVGADAASVPTAPPDQQRHQHRCGGRQHPALPGLAGAAAARTAARRRR